jgi:hypothetical protein
LFCFVLFCFVLFCFVVPLTHPSFFLLLGQVNISHAL